MAQRWSALGFQGWGEGRDDPGVLTSTGFGDPAGTTSQNRLLTSSHFPLAPKAWIVYVPVSPLGVGQKCDHRNVKGPHLLLKQIILVVLISKQQISRCGTPLTFRKGEMLWVH